MSPSASKFRAGTDSTPGGSPTSGNGTTAMSKDRASSVPREASLARSTAKRMTPAFTGVVRMVHLTPRAAKSAAMSAAGMRCPGVRKGKKRMRSGCCSPLIAMAGRESAPRRCWERSGVDFTWQGVESKVARKTGTSDRMEDTIYTLNMIWILIFTIRKHAISTGFPTSTREPIFVTG